jgi:hypothetical protein
MPAFHRAAKDLTLSPSKGEVAGVARCKSLSFDRLRMRIYNRAATATMVP